MLAGAGSIIFFTFGVSGGSKGASASGLTACANLSQLKVESTASTCGRLSVLSVLYCKKSNRKAQGQHSEGWPSEPTSCVETTRKVWDSSKPLCPRTAAFGTEKSVWCGVGGANGHAVLALHWFIRDKARFLNILRGSERVRAFLGPLDSCLPETPGLATLATPSGILGKLQHKEVATSETDCTQSTKGKNGAKSASEFPPKARPAATPVPPVQAPARSRRPAAARRRARPSAVGFEARPAPSAPNVRFVQNGDLVIKSRSKPFYRYGSGSKYVPKLGTLVLYCGRMVV